MTCSLMSLVQALDREGILKEAVLPEGHAFITGLSYDNRTVKPGELFVCKGAAFRRSYLVSALEKGALLYMAEEKTEEAPHLLVRDIRRAMALAAGVFYRDEAASVRKVGITGTKGKTTAATLVSAILDNYTVSHGSEKNAMLSSLRVYDGEVEQKARLTTPEAFDLWGHLSAAGRRHLPFAVLEVSSQALKYDRVYGLPFEAVAFLNIGEDHISEIEHRDFEDYFSSKLKIFENAGIACIFSGSEGFRRISGAAEECGCRLFTYGWRQEDDLVCTGAIREGGGTRFTVRVRAFDRERRGGGGGTTDGAYDTDRIGNTAGGTGGRSGMKEQAVSGQAMNQKADAGREEEWEFFLGLPGRYNLENALAALSLVYVLGIPFSYAVAALAETTVPGRGRCFSSRDGSAAVVVDYAHNGMSLEALLDYADEAFPGRIRGIVFGCPGGKARNRRRDMGLLAGERADFVILTEDDPGPEETEAICQEIAGYVAAGGARCETLADRNEAIARAFAILSEAERPGLLLVCGKGAETEQKKAGGPVFYEGDETVVRKCLDAYDEEKSRDLLAARV